MSSDRKKRIQKVVYIDKPRFVLSDPNSNEDVRYVLRPGAQPSPQPTPQPEPEATPREIEDLEGQEDLMRRKHKILGDAAQVVLTGSDLDAINNGLPPKLDRIKRMMKALEEK